MNLWKEFNKGIWEENPVFRLLLGMCPTLAVTGQAMNGLAMGLATAAVLLMSGVIISSLRKVIPPRVRIPVFIVVIATLVTMIDMVMAGYFHRVHKVLGLFVPLIVVNCIILGRAEAFASRRPIFDSFIDALGMGVGFTASLVFLGSVRELLGNGSIFGLGVAGPGYQPFLLMVLPPGAFLILGVLLACMNKLREDR